MCALTLGTGFLRKVRRSKKICDLFASWRKRKEVVGDTQQVGYPLLRWECPHHLSVDPHAQILVLLLGRQVDHDTPSSSQCQVRRHCFPL